jgi:GNAT superfamily N-acetyltransferase
MNLGPPEPISAAHPVDLFSCGQPALDRWLRRHALANEGRRSRTFVVRDLGAKRIAAFYCLSATAIKFAEAVQEATAGTPEGEHIPAILLGRLAVDKHYQGIGLGAEVLTDAVDKTKLVTQSIGARLLLAHAKDADARDFYLKHDFRSSPIDDLHVMLVL